MASTPVTLLALATAVPPHQLEQSAVADFARRIYASSFARYPKLADVFVNAGIERRYSVRPIEWFEAPHDWTERTQAYLDGASALFVQAAKAALDRAGVSARDVDVIVTVSSTGIATPSLEARVGTEMGFKESATRVPVFGLGCAGGVSGLSIGARLARAEPGEVVLVVVVELCTLAFRSDRSAKADVISSALFGDGATETEYRHARRRLLKAHFRADARFQTGRRDAGGRYRHDHINVARRDSGAVERCFGGLHE